MAGRSKGWKSTPSSSQCWWELQSKSPLLLARLSWGWRPIWLGTKPPKTFSQFQICPKIFDLVAIKVEHSQYQCCYSLFHIGTIDCITLAFMIIITILRCAYWTKVSLNKAPLNHDHHHHHHLLSYSEIGELCKWWLTCPSSLSLDSGDN